MLYKVRQGEKSEKEMGHVLFYIGWTKGVVLKPECEWSKGESHGCTWGENIAGSRGEVSEVVCRVLWSITRGPERDGDLETCVGATSRQALRALCEHLGSEWCLGCCGIC